MTGTVKYQIKKEEMEMALKELKAEGEKIKAEHAYF